MKIAFFTDNFTPQVDGIVSSLTSTIEQLSAKGHKIIVFAPKGNFKTEPIRFKNTKIVRLPTLPREFYPRAKVSILGLPRVMLELLKFKPDVLHVHTPFTIGGDAVFASKILQKPLVGTVHFYFLTPDILEWIRNGLTKKLFLRFQNLFHSYYFFFYNQCDFLTVPSRDVMAALQEAGLKRETHHIPNGITLPKLPVPKHTIARFKKKYHLKKQVLLHTGRLSAEKKIPVVIKAFQMLVKKNPELRLLIIGDGPARKDIEQLVSDLHLDQMVSFTGFIEHEKLLSSGIIACGDLFITASPMENQPVAILEAMSYGLPIVAVGEGGLRELVSGNGFLVGKGKAKDLAAKAWIILSDPDLAHKMSLRSRELSKEFSVEHTIKKLLTLYTAAIKKPRKHAHMPKFSHKMFEGFERYLNQ